ncbi:MAG: hypothetical protein R3D60_03285 [Paracoccaceae bacterium]
MLALVGVVGVVAGYTVNTLFSAGRIALEIFPPVNPVTGDTIFAMPVPEGSEICRYLPYDDSDRVTVPEHQVFVSLSLGDQGVVFIMVNRSSVRIGDYDVNEGVIERFGFEDGTRHCQTVESASLVSLTAVDVEAPSRGSVGYGVSIVIGSL